MSYTTPNTEILLCRGVPIPSSGIFNVWWRAPLVRRNYFESKAAVTVSSYTYSRATRDVIKVAAPIEDCLPCNYMLFCNASYENRDWCAWITNVEYISDACTAIHFKIDYLGTYCYQLESRKTCYVVRCHAEYDNLFGNLEPEPVTVGDYVQCGVSNHFWEPTGSATATTQLEEYDCIAAICDTTESVSTRLYDHVMSGSDLYAFTTDSAGLSAFGSLIGKYVPLKPEAVVNLYMLPRILISASDENSGSPITSYTGQGGFDFDDDPCTGEEVFYEGHGATAPYYRPVNKKLYSYPYNYYMVTNGEAELKLKYEYCNAWTPSLRVYGNISYPPTLVCRPRRYDMSSVTPSGWVNVCPTQSLTLTDFPQCSFSTDSFKQWAAQKGVSSVFSAVGSLAGAAVSALTGNVVGLGLSAVGLVSDIAGTVSEGASAALGADNIVGNSSAPNAEITHSRYSIYSGRMAIDMYQAMQIDSFFTRYGYAQNRVMSWIPVCRPAFFYVQTQGYNVVSQYVTGAGRAEIEQRFDNGVTLWMQDYADDCGDFSLDNDPV